jgi:hypothetical protein
MLELLTNYLLQYKTVTVPNVGTLHLVQQAPQLNVADKRLEPPSYIVEIRQEENATDHQLGFLQSFAGKDNDAVATKLELFGASLRQKISNGGFDWQGLGMITSDTQSLLLRLAALQPLSAEKVIRQDAKHTILVGDREVTSDTLSDRNSNVAIPRKKRTVSIFIGWLLLVLALLAIALLLYFGKFNVNAAGSKLPPTGSVSQSTKLLPV